METNMYYRNFAAFMACANSHLIMHTSVCQIVIIFYLTRFASVDVITGESLCYSL